MLQEQIADHFKIDLLGMRVLLTTVACVSCLREQVLILATLNRLLLSRKCLGNCIFFLVFNRNYCRLRFLNCAVTTKVVDTVIDPCGLTLIVHYLRDVSFALLLLVRVEVNRRGAQESCTHPTAGITGRCESPSIGHSRRGRWTEEWQVLAT